MDRIGALEKKLESRTDSSFYPECYRPTAEYNPSNVVDEPEASDTRTTVPRKSTMFFPMPTTELQNSSLFFPCHYFDYIGGTSTGG
jgi:hypothetical protein